MDQSVVPKFGSFRPTSSTQSSATTDIPHREQSESSGRDGDSGHDHRRKHRDERRHHHHKLSRGDVRDRDQHMRHADQRGHRNSSPSQPIRTSDDLEESDLFFIDRRGDSKNVTYGTLHRYSIPSYRTAGYGSVIGLPTSAKTDRDESNDKEVVLRYADRLRQRAPRILASKQDRASDKRLRFIVSDPKDALDATDIDFIELSNPRKRKRDLVVSAVDLAQAAPVDYRSIGGKAMPSLRPTDEDLAFASDSDSHELDEDISLQYRQENSRLSNQAKVDPSRSESWLALVGYQANLVRPGAHASSSTSSERRTLADLRVSILKEALSHVTKGCSGYDKLLLALIEEGRHIWDNVAVAAKWKYALTQCPASTLLWTRCLDFIQDGHASFRYETCRDTYLQCFKMLRNAREEHDVDMHALAEVQIVVLLRFTSFVQEAGYNELAIAIWQAVLELHATGRNAGDLSNSPEILVAFEEFWENESPRLGEEGATGWCRPKLESARRHPAKYKRAASESRDPLKIYTVEESGLRGFILPATMGDEDATLDPFRCVMYSDISDVLENVLSPLPRFPLLQAFLVFMGLPAVPHPDGDIDARRWLLDQHIDPRSASFTDPDSNGTIRTGYNVLSTVDLFDNAFDNFCHLHGPQSTDTEDCAAFVDRLLCTIVAEYDHHELFSAYLLAFKLRLWPDQAAKWAKRMLKANPSNLRHYNAYALIQAKLNSIDAALSVWTLALGMIDKLRTDDQDDAVLLWNCRLHIQLRAGQGPAALQTFLTLAEPISAIPTDGSIDHVRRLKTTRLLEEVIDRTILSFKHNLAVLGVDCLAWLHYLMSSHNLSSALGIYFRYCRRFEAAPIALEHLHQYRAQLIHTHLTSQRAYTPAAVLSEICTSLLLFPNNTFLLSIHSQLAARDRLRALLRPETTSAQEKSVVQWMHRIKTEIEHLRDEIAGATTDSVRASFNKALLGTNSEAKHAPALWFMWLHFEYDVLQENARGMKQLKKVFLDGMRHLPWHKDWIITGLQILSEGGMDEVELRQVYETMAERGLRTRVDIEI